ncbi:uncharacterized protein LOC126738965 isoform X2 [Anthonomus grandis grandis]|uniref:uncharacterized protein LOC126738965 isoform X2 n=1 Tax=Anthonomus grandis grandis TaxID=2921223 RepID=UPI002165307F|nr:uncharacterized protein LOC126738965 isoform X2 [Anthonomus grandis grandis]XP_050300428.1 uncharacterized protein LOC126738965 isoform X2 [Anthonomus grandis grandis]XP_050300429.1 uncharacterized protein LOC126738965 isoform X2 [Anthonomus grandis grandis]
MVFTCTGGLFVESGVAVLSCSDCSGSSTASSDITDPGSPFSTASNHSEDSGNGTHAAKMPPAQSAHHPHWPWAAHQAEDVGDEGGKGGSPVKRTLNEKNTAYSKRAKNCEESTVKKQLTACLNGVKSGVQGAKSMNVCNNNYKGAKKPVAELNSSKMQQGKITEYFKTQTKSGLRKDILKIKSLRTEVQAHQIVVNSALNKSQWKVKATKRMLVDKPRKYSSTPRKILPAPNKLPEALPANNPLPNIHPFAPTMTLTAVSFPPNLTYIPTKTAKPADNIFVPQFAAISNDKTQTWSNLISRQPATTCLPVPVQKIATLNANLIKVNATVVPMVTLNALARPPSTTTNIAAAANVTLSVDTALPTVLPARPKVLPDNTASCFSTFGKQYSNSSSSSSPTEVQTASYVNGGQTEEPYRTEECQTHQEEQPSEPPDVGRKEGASPCWSEGNNPERIPEQKSPSPDSDSGFSSRGSLEISVDEPITVEPKKSPILSQPKTIRFPLIKPRKIDDGRELGKSPAHSNDSRCRWNDCVAQFDTSGALLEHLQVKHVISQSQENKEQYLCLWRGCKVHGRTSCSISWLERHVLAHAGTKPFRCIVDGCGQRFNSQLMLERHVNNHFNSDGTQNTNTKKSVENGPVKLFKRNGRIIRFRRQPWSARMFDFIDPGIMEGLQHRLLCMTQVRTLGQIGSAGEVVQLRSEILARRTDSKGAKHLLVRWHPQDVAPDEWVVEKEYKPTKALPIPSLSPKSREALGPSLFPENQKIVGQKHRRKPLKSTST